MKKFILLTLSAIMFCMVANTVLAIESDAAKNNDTKSFSLVHWNILRNIYKINGIILENAKNPKTTAELITDPNFAALITKTFTPDSYTALLDQNTTALIHPNPLVIHKKISDQKSTSATQIIIDAIKKDDCTRGFYTWIDKQEKYMVACPIIGMTKNGDKLYYVYTMYTRSMPSYYIQTLKNSAK